VLPQPLTFSPQQNGHRRNTGLSVASPRPSAFSTAAAGFPLLSLAQTTLRILKNNLVTDPLYPRPEPPLPSFFCPFTSLFCRFTSSLATFTLVIRDLYLVTGHLDVVPDHLHPRLLPRRRSNERGQRCFSLRQPTNYQSYPAFYPPQSWKSRRHKTSYWKAEWPPCCAARPAKTGSRKHSWYSAHYSRRQWESWTILHHFYLNSASKIRLILMRIVVLCFATTQENIAAVLVNDIVKRPRRSVLVRHADSGFHISKKLLGRYRNRVFWSEDGASSVG